jgi:sulfate/thiosulfate transport system substrate-binding protein
MNQRAPRSFRTTATLSALLWLACVGCKQRQPGADAQSATLTLGAYTTPREAYGSILPVFQKQVRAQSGKAVSFKESYLGSGAQARAILGGFEADIAALSLAPDIQTLAAGGLVKPDWAAGEHAGIVTQSVVVIGVRPGNPKGIKDWTDLARPGVEVLTPNVRTSGGAMWNVLAIYGAVQRAEGGNEAKAIETLAAILRNVKIMDRSGRDSLLTFERGVGDAVITYENEILVGRKAGKTYDYVVPPASIIIENPVAVVSKYAERHGVQALAESFVKFLFTPEVQRIFVEHGLRPVHPAVADEAKARFPAVPQPFAVADLGGWQQVQAQIFGEGGIYDRALTASQGAKL